MRAALEASFRAALEATDPCTLTRAHLPEETPALVVCLGKAAIPMARAAADAYPGAPGLVVTGDGYGGQAGHFMVLEAAHPVPDERSAAAAAAVLERLERLGAGDLVLVLLSGGGSALLCAPWGVSLECKQAVNRALLRSGAAIGEINAVRKHLSRVKGGQLAAATRARILTLVLSDVPGDDLATVASGPTVADPTTFADALAVLDRRGLDLPAARGQFERGARGALPETPKPGDERLARVKNQLIGGGWQLLEAAAEYWRAAGDARVVTLSDSFGGEARELAGFHADLVRSIRAHASPWAPPWCCSRAARRRSPCAAREWAVATRSSCSPSAARWAPTACGGSPATPTASTEPPRPPAPSSRPTPSRVPPRAVSTPLAASRTTTPIASSASSTTSSRPDRPATTSMTTGRSSSPSAQPAPIGTPDESRRRADGATVPDDHVTP